MVISLGLCGAAALARGPFAVRFVCMKVSVQRRLQRLPQSLISVHFLLPQQDPLMQSYDLTSGGVSSIVRFCSFGSVFRGLFDAIFAFHTEIYLDRALLSQRISLPFARISFLKRIAKRMPETAPAIVSEIGSAINIAVTASSISSGSR